MLNLLLLSDGKPGHYKKSLAVAEAIAKRQAAHVDWLNVRMRLPILHDVLRRYFRWSRRPPALQWLHATHRFPLEPLPDSPPDLIISSGGKTVFANAWLAQHYACANVFIGHTRGVHDSCFSRIVVFGGPATSDPRRIRSLIPTGIDSETLARAAADYLGTRNPEFARQRHWTLLIGGNSGGYRFGAGDWRRLADAIRTLAERHGVRWLVTTSRRTPRRVEQFLMADNVRRHIDELVIFRTDRRRIFNALLACGDAIFCTEDSGTMLTEAAATGKPVVSVRPRRAAATAALNQLLRLYVDRRRLKQFAIDQLSELSEVDVLEGFDSALDDELAPVCERILELLARRTAA